MLRKYILVIIVLILFTQLVKAQESTYSNNSVSGFVIYQQEVNMLYASTQSDTLYFSRTSSKFKWNLNAIDPSRASKKYENVPVSGEIGMQAAIYYGVRVNILNTTKDSLFSLVGMPNIDKLLYVQEKVPKIDWSVKDSTKQIGNYKVQKAIAHFRGRDYTAWFTPGIPVSYGPWKLQGLPGLILQAYDQTGNINFSATEITIRNTDPVSPIKLTGKEQVISLAEYKEIIKNFDNYQKKNLLKMVRPYLSKEELSKMTFEVKPVNHMEIFDEDK